MASRCRKFVPNLFNKSKCQSCFGAKDAHSAEALESSKAARKISKCAYLFVAPDFDFTNPIQRTKRWQRRFFILYDDGELTYSVDDNPSTIPQGSVDMNRCTDVYDAEEVTGHEMSLGIEVPGESNVFMKGVSKEEIRRWFDVLVMYPRSLTIKTKRPAKSDSPEQGRSDASWQHLGNTGSGLSRHHSMYPSGSEKSVSDDDDADSVKSKDSDVYERMSRQRGRSKHRDVRRCKSEVRPSDLKLAEDEYNSRVASRDASREASPAAGSVSSVTVKKNADKAGLRSSLKDRSTDSVDGVTHGGRKGEPETFSSVRSMKQKKANNKAHTAEVKASSSAAEPTNQKTESSAAANQLKAHPAVDANVTLRNSRRHSSLGLAAQSKQGAGISLRHSFGGGNKKFDYHQQALADANETDELKIAKSEHAKKTQEKSPIARKGWLVLQDQRTKSWSRHWFVLCGSALSYYKDAKAEESNDIDGVMDLSSVYAVTTVKVDRNHGFKVSTKDGDHVLSAMTSGIRRNWTEAIESIIEEQRKADERSAKQDMGFVFEPPLRSPAAATASPSLPVLAPVTPNSNSRINLTLRDVAERIKESSDNAPIEDRYTSTTTTPASISRASRPTNIEPIREVSVITNQADASNITVLEPPKSPSQRIKEKSRAKTPPRVRSPPPPTLTATPLTCHVTSETSLLLPSGGSSDENEEGLTAKLLEAQKENEALPDDESQQPSVQHLQQHVQDANSTVRKQRVEIESLQTKLDLTTSQLHDMETALTHSAQNLNKERKHVQKLTDAFHRQQEGNNQLIPVKAKCELLERQLEEATRKLADQETRMLNVKNMEEQLEMRTNKLATLEKVLSNTRRHLQDAVDNVRDTELQYQTKIEEMEAEYDEERADMQERLHELEDSLERYVTDSHNTVNSDLTELNNHLVREKNLSIQRLEEVVKEQRGKLDQLMDENESYRQQVDEDQVLKDRIVVLRNHLESTQKETHDLKHSNQSLQNKVDKLLRTLKEREAQYSSKCQENTSLLASINELQEQCRQLQESRNKGTIDESETINAKLNTALEANQAELNNLRLATVQKDEEIEASRLRILELKDKCDHMESEVQNLESHIESLDASQQPEHQQGKGLDVPQVISIIEIVIKSCEKMTESAVAMLAGEMIVTEIKCSLNFNSEQRSFLTSRACEQVQKRCSGIKQRLNYLVKRSTSKKLYDSVKAEKEDLTLRNAELEKSTNVEVQSSALVQQNSADMAYMFQLLQKSQAELECISSDFDKMHKSKVQQNIQALAESLSRVQTTPAPGNDTRRSYCEMLAVRSAVLFELVRWTSEDVDLQSLEQGLKKCISAGDNNLCSIEDVSLRNFATLLTEKLLLSHELETMVSEGKWKTPGQTPDGSSNTAASLAAEALFRFSADAKTSNDAISTQSAISSLLTHSNFGRCSALSAEERTELLIKELNYVNTAITSVDKQIASALQSYCSEYTADLLNYEVITIGQLEQFLSLVTDSLYNSVLDLCKSGQVSELSSDWLHQEMYSRRQEFNGVGNKGMPFCLPNLAMRRAQLHTQFSYISSLLQHSTSTSFKQGLAREADKLNALSTELSKRNYADGSPEARIAELAQRLQEGDNVLSVYTRHYGECVHQVMREIIFCAQSSVNRHFLSEVNLKSLDLDLCNELERIKLELKNLNQKKGDSDVGDHELEIQAMRDEIEITRVEHEKELEESKMDMRMVLKSVKAEEQKMVMDLTEEIARLKDEIAEQQRRHQAELSERERAGDQSNPALQEEHNSLKNKIRDLESCLHEMQEEFEEELYHERQSHLAELEQNRTQIMQILAKVESNDMSTSQLKQHYEQEMDKLKAEQTSLQQWIDDIREAHKDEIEALLHEKDCALSDEVAATQAALEAMQSAHTAQLNDEKSKVSQYKEKVAITTEVERKLLMQSRDVESKDKHIAQLQEKLSHSNKQLAKLEVQLKRALTASDELKVQSQQSQQRNKQLVEQFSQELSNMKTGRGSLATSECLALRAQVDNMKESLQLERQERQLLETKLQQVKTKSDITPSDVKVTPQSLEEKKRKSTTGNTYPSLSDSAGSEEVFSPRRLVDQSFNIFRSKSNSMLGVKLPLSRTKRLSGSDMVEPVQRLKSGGISVAERLRMFNT